MGNNPVVKWNEAIIKVKKAVDETQATFNRTPHYLAAVALQQAQRKLQFAYERAKTQIKAIVVHDQTDPPHPLIIAIDALQEIAKAPPEDLARVTPGIEEYRRRVAAEALVSISRIEAEYEARRRRLIPGQIGQELA